MTPYLVCPEFLPALTRLLARSGLPLSEIAAKTAAAEAEKAGDDTAITCKASTSALKRALEGGQQSDDLAERYASEAVLACKYTDGQSAASTVDGVNRAGEPPVVAELRSLRQDALRRLAIPGAVLLSVNVNLLRRGPQGVAVIAASDLEGGKEDCQRGEQQEVVDVVICEVAYGQQKVGTTSGVSEQHGGEVLPGASTSELKSAASTTQAIRAWRVEVVQIPSFPPGDVQEATVTSAGAWAEALCRRCASPVYVAPGFHAPLAQLLVELGALPASLSARTPDARGLLSAELVALARKLRAPQEEGSEAPDSDRDSERAAKACLCLAAASASSTVAADAATAGQTFVKDADNVPLLLLKGRDAIPEGALVAGATVEREVGHGVTVSLGASSRGTLLLTRRRMPRGRTSAALPTRGTSLACLLTRPVAQEFGLTDGIAPALTGSPSAVVEDVLARQVGLRVLDVAVPDGRPDRAKACRHLAEACGASLWVDVAPDGLRARITGARPEAEAAAQMVSSLASRSIPVPERLAWRVVGRGGTGIRQLEQDSGGAWIRVESDEKLHRIEMFGETSAVCRAEALIQERHAHDSLEIPSDAVPRIIGRGGSAIREMEANSGGASICVDAVKCFVEVMGEAPAVQRAMAELRERSAPPRRLEVPRHIIPYIRNGTNKRELETLSGTFLKVLTEAEACFVEICGYRSCIAKAEKLLEKLLQQHAYGSLEVPRDLALHVMGRGGMVLREVEASTGTSIQVGPVQDCCLVEVFGQQTAVDAALQVLKRRTVVSRRCVCIPRHCLSYVIGRAGAGAQEIEAATGASLHMDLGDGNSSEVCTIEAIGDEKQVEQAEALLRVRSEASVVKVPSERVSWIIGRSGTTIREIQAHTATMIHIPNEHGETCEAQVYGSSEARAAACAKIAAILSSGKSAATSTLHPSLQDARLRSRSPPSVSSATRILAAAAAAAPKKDSEGSTGAPRQPAAAAVFEHPLFAPKAGMLTPPCGAQAKAMVPPVHPSAQSVWTCTASLRYGHAPRERPGVAIADDSEEQRIEDGAQGGTASRTLSAGGPTAGAHAEAQNGTLSTSPDVAFSKEDAVGNDKGTEAEAQNSTMSGDLAAACPAAGATGNDSGDQAAELSAAVSSGLGSVSPTAAAKDNGRATEAEAQDSALWNGLDSARPTAGNGNRPTDVAHPTAPTTGNGAGTEAEVAGSLFVGKQLPERLVSQSSSALPWLWRWPLGVESPAKQGSQAEGNQSSAQIHDGVPCTAEDLAVERSPTLSSSCKNSQDNSYPAGVASSRADEAAPLIIESTPCLPVAAETPSSPLPNLQWVRNAPAPPESSSSDKIDSPNLSEQQHLEGVDSFDSKKESMTERGVQPFPWSWSLPIELSKSAEEAQEPAPVSPSAAQENSQAGHQSGSLDHGPSPCRNRGRSRSRHREEGLQNSPGETATVESSRQAPPRRSGKGVPPGPPPPSRWSLPAERAKAAARAAANEAKAKPPPQCQAAASPAVQPSVHDLKQSSPNANRPPSVTDLALPLFPAAAADSDSWAVLPTPVRATAAHPAAPPPAKRSRRGCSPELTKESVAAVPSLSRPKLFVLDGMNILKSSNNISWGMDDKDPSLEWDQLERACRYYTSRGHQVSVYLPPLRAGHEDRLDRCCREFGNIFVSCRSASDDQFMINTVKLYEDEHGHCDLQASSDIKQTEPSCCIVTNDRFEDWKHRGDVDSAWVDRHCVRFAFGPGGFVPSKLM